MWGQRDLSLAFLTLMLWLKFPNLRQLLNLLVQLCVEFRQFCIRSRGDIISHTTLSGLSRPTRTHFHPAMRGISRHVDIRAGGTRLENRGLSMDISLDKVSIYIKYGLQSNFSGHSISIYPANCRNLSSVESPDVSSSCATHQCFSE